MNTYANATTVLFTRFTEAAVQESIVRRRGEHDRAIVAALYDVLSHAAPDDA